MYEPIRRRQRDQETPGPLAKLPESELIPTLPPLAFPTPSTPFLRITLEISFLRFWVSSTSASLTENVFRTEEDDTLLDNSSNLPQSTGVLPLPGLEYESVQWLLVICQENHM
jgi:hypothetical protein